MRGICGTLIWSPAAAHFSAQARLFGDIFRPQWVVARPKSQHTRLPSNAMGDYNRSRLRKSPRFPPEKRLTLRLCHSERSEPESKNLFVVSPVCSLRKLRDASSHSTSLRARLSLNTTALAVRLNQSPL